MTRSWSELDNEKLTRIAMTSRNLAVATLDLGYILCSLSRVMSLSRKNITGFSFFPFVELVSLEDGETRCTSKRSPGRPERGDNFIAKNLDE